MLPAAVRYRVLRRDGYRCAWCYRSDLPLEIDHIVARGMGGRHGAAKRASDSLANLRALCPICHAARHGQRLLFLQEQREQSCATCWKLARCAVGQRVVAGNRDARDDEAEATLAQGDGPAAAGALSG